MTPDEIKNFRSKKGWSQAKMASELDVSIHAVQAWEQGKNPLPKIVEKLLLSQTEISFPLELIREIQDYAREMGGNFDEALFSAIRAGLPKKRPSRITDNGQIKSSSSGMTVKRRPRDPRK